MLCVVYFLNLVLNILNINLDSKEKTVLLTIISTSKKTNPKIVCIHMLSCKYREAICKPSTNKVL